MRERRRVAAIFVVAVLLVLPLLFSLGRSGVVDFLFSRIPADIGDSTPSVFIDPVRVIDSRLQAENASKFIVHVNITSATDLFTWQISLNWNASRLQVSRVLAGEFLNRTTSLNKTSSAPAYYGGLGSVINVVNNTAGTLLMAETVLNDTTGIVAGVSGSGRLVSVEFLVVGYGHSSLTVSMTGSSPTTLLNAAGDEVSFTTADGYFRNVLPGDVNEDRTVDVFDVLKVKYHRSGPPPGPGGYLRETDINDDSFVDVFDILIVKANLGLSI